MSADAPSQDDLPVLSIVVPCYNEQEVLPHLFARLLPFLERLEPDFEVVCVNDGSKDATLSILRDYAARDPRIQVVHFARNYGKEAATTAGIDFARGLGVIPIDADLQDPPELMEEFVKRWLSGVDVVYGVRSNRQSDGWLKRHTAQAFYKLFNKISEIKIPYNAGDYRLMDRRVVETLKQYGERTRFMKGLFAHLGFLQEGVEFVRKERAAGDTKWGGWKLWRFALDGIFSFTSAPLHVWTYIGLIITTLAMLMVLRIVIGVWQHGPSTPGFPALATMILFFSGSLLMGIGILGEYLGRLFVERKQRPLYVVAQRVGAIAKTSPSTLNHGGFVAPPAGWLIARARLAQRGHTLTPLHLAATVDAP